MLESALLVQVSSIYCRYLSGDNVQLFSISVVAVCFQVLSVEMLYMSDHLFTYSFRFLFRL